VWRSRTIRFTVKPTKGPKVPRQRDEVSILVAGTAHYKVEDMRTAVSPRDFLFAVRQWDCRRDGEVIGTKQHRRADKPSLSIMPISTIAPSSRGCSGDPCLPEGTFYKAKSGKPQYGSAVKSI
jgi:hypothetical protein